MSIATLRYYERRGLIPPPSRTSSGYRAFEPETVRTVRLIKRAQALGFTLKEIHNLLSICLSHGSCADLHEVAQAKVDDLDHQIRSLSDKREALGELLTDCPRDTAAPATDCPILEQLEQFEPSNDEVVGDDSAG